LTGLERESDIKPTHHAKIPTAIRLLETHKAEGGERAQLFVNYALTTFKAGKDRKRIML